MPDALGKNQSVVFGSSGKHQDDFLSTKTGYDILGPFF